MDKKSFWNNNFLGFALKNILIAAVIIVGLSWGIFILLNIYTHHGKTQNVPALKGLTIEEASAILNNHSLEIQIIDSVYSKNDKLGTIVEQNPLPKSIVKQGRQVYVVVNSKRIRQVAIPPVVDTSLRQAEAMLSSIGIALTSVTYAPSDYKDLVLGIQYKGKPIAEGTKIDEGSSVTLIVGNGFGGEKSSVPYLSGMDMNTAISAITTSAYTIGGIIYDEEPAGDEGEYYVYRQRPHAGDSISLGEKIDLWVSKDKNKKDDSVTIKAREKQEIKDKEKQKSKDIEDFF
ncbi:MAG: PASTA domain-containing protein [Paludibacteraceae bacterium]